MNRREFLTGLVAAGAARRLAPPQLITEPATLTRFPYIQNTRPDATTIMWAAARPADAIVAITKDGVNFRYARPVLRNFTAGEVSPLPAFTQFRVDVSDLEPGTDYVYQLHIDSEMAAQGRFRTACDGPFRFVVMGDSGQMTTEQIWISQLIAGEPASFLMHAGDIAYFRGTQKDFQSTYFDVYRQSLGSVPFFPCPGNHEYMTPDAAAYISSHAVPTNNVPAADHGRYYSFDWSNAHFICLDSNEGLQQAAIGQGQMLNWLENDLRATRKFWRIAMFHHPPFAGGPNQSDPICAMVREHLLPVLERHGVQLVFSGHEHSYQRSRDIRGGAAALPGTGTIYMTSGGGGAALYPVSTHPLVGFAASVHHYLRVDVSGTRLDLTAINTAGAAVEQFALQPAPVLLDDPAQPAVSLVPSGLETLIRIRGRSLAAEETFIPVPPGPSEVGGAVVMVNQRPIPLIYASPTQIWGQLPADVQRPFALTITTPNGSAHTFVD
jgi:acid phosphatase type 7